MARILATLLVWVMFTVILISLLTSVTGVIREMSDAASFGVVLALATAAAISTAAIWAGSRESGDESMSRSIAKAKRRRSRRAEELLESLDDEEIYDLEALLLSRGESSRGHRSDPSA